MFINLFQTGTKTTVWDSLPLCSIWARSDYFSFGILGSLPLPIFAGSDILKAILAASHHDPWYEYAAVG
jgi:hypothetical protein